jgi:hypothetical protein
VVYDLDRERPAMLLLLGRASQLEWVPGTSTLVALHDGGRTVTRWDYRSDAVEHLPVAS